jgi:fanconi-associated nuclease 1
MDKFIVRRAGPPSSSTQRAQDREPVDERRVKRTKTEHDDTPTAGGNQDVLLDYLKEEDEDDAAGSGGDLELGADSYKGISFEEPLAAIEATDEVIEDSFGAADEAASDEKPLYRSSIYVDAFNIALDTVLEHEEHLFNEKEKAVFAAWRGLDYEAQYL